MGAEEDREIRQGSDQTTPLAISRDQFLAWKRQKDAELSAKQAEAARKREEDIAAGRVPMNGRELFLHQPWVFDDTHL
ncbi:Zinc finger CCCH domain protein [Hirschfeldia incana]|nr:Zinc finger CCCH domain protein [Hirschfeldia incana]KAJ0257593.1 Zinc finger CCCH domain protein [Hirschfeldia incana]